MDDWNLNKVKHALDLTHDASTHTQERKKMYEYLEQSTKDISRCQSMAFEFMRSEQDKYRLFGYHCIRKVCEKWPDISKENQQSLKNMAIVLFKNGVNDSTVNQGLLKEKIAELIVTLSIECYPNEWNDLMPNLFTFASQNMISLEILLIILKDLIHFSSDNALTIQRRQKKRKTIQKALMKINQQILQMICVTIQKCGSQMFQQNPSNKQSQSQMKAKLVLKACLEAMPQFLNQFPLGNIIDSQVLQGLSKVLECLALNNSKTSKDLYQSAMNAYSAFWSRKFTQLSYSSTDDKKLVMDRVVMTLWKELTNIAMKLYEFSQKNNSGNSNDDSMAIIYERLDHQMELQLRLLKLLRHYLIHEHRNKENTLMASNLKISVLALWECVRNCGDIGVRIRTMSIWIYVLDQSLTLIGFDSSFSVLKQTNGEYKQVVIGLMKYALEHSRKKYYSLNQFESEIDFQRKRNGLKQGTKLLLQSCFSLCPFEGIQTIGQFTYSILMTNNNNNNQSNGNSSNNTNTTVKYVNSIGHCTIENARYIAMDGLCDVYKVVFEQCIVFENENGNKNKYRTVNESAFDGNEQNCMDLMQKMHGIVIDWMTQNSETNNFRDTQLMSRAFILIGYFTLLYDRKPECLSQTFELLLNSFPLKLPLCPDSDDGYDMKCNAIAHKRKIAHTLLKMAKKATKSMNRNAQFLQYLWKRVIDIISAKRSNKANANTNDDSKEKSDWNFQNNVKNERVVMADVLAISDGPTSDLYGLLVCLNLYLKNCNTNGNNDNGGNLDALLSSIVNELNGYISDLDVSKFAKMVQFPADAHDSNYNLNDQTAFAYRIRALLSILSSTLIASFMNNSGQNVLKDLYRQSANDSNNNNTNAHAKATVYSWKVYQSIFESVIKLNSLLSMVYTAEFERHMNGNYKSIVYALNVKSLYELFNLKYEILIRNPMDKPKFMLPLERSVIWIMNCRDHTSKILAIASYFDDNFFSCNGGGVSMINQSFQTNWSDLPLSHLAIEIKHFLMNFVQLCHPTFYENIIPLITDILRICSQKLNKAWNQFCGENNKINNDNNANGNIFDEQKGNDNGRQKSAALRNEVHHEFAMRDCAQKIMGTLAMFCINCNEKGFTLLATDRRNGGSKTNKNNENNKNGCLKQDKMVKLLLLDDKCRKELLVLIQSSFRWQDHTTHVKSAQLSTKLLLFIVNNGMDNLYSFCGEMFVSVLSALSRCKIGDSQHVSDLNGFCVAICQYLGPASPDIPIGVLQKCIQNVSDNDANTLCGLIKSEKGTHPPVTYRQTIKSFTNKYVIGKNFVF